MKWNPNFRLEHPVLKNVQDYLSKYSLAHFGTWCTLMFAVYRKRDSNSLMTLPMERERIRNIRYQEMKTSPVQIYARLVLFLDSSKHIFYLIRKKIA